ncbi:GxGYxYP domain-containing protein [Sedimentisphaera salicampi]|uniref:Carbohydrate binding domain protein n=1 Tax=Sedimentisphaera salicampi TaxID=1941349 RepID=A0A1W6LJ57_9BACT|nr:GxGYxYP domain-containing protein [Sedimentisphaera salicampi]ARN55774.1 hypothetical protein STSP1_00139 [Sedimentisphaera salicampi]
MKISVQLLILFSLMFPVSAFSSVYNENNNLVNNPYGEAGWQNWYRSQNAEIADISAGAGEKSFKLQPVSGTHSDIRSVKLVGEPNQKLKFKYSFKSEPGSSIEQGSSYAQVRFLDSSGSVLNAASYELVLTSGQWIDYTHEGIVVPNGTVNLDVRFITGAFQKNSQGEFFVDDIYLYQELPKFSSCDNYPDQLYVISKGSMNEEEKVLIQSLQGLLAQDKPEIYIDMGNDDYLNDLQANHGVNYTRVDSLFWYMNNYSSDLSGYILADLDEPQSMTAAVSISGIMNAVIVDDSLESWVQSFGLSKLADTRGKDCRWAYENYWDQLNKNGIVVKSPDRNEVAWAYNSIDWYIAQKLLWWWDESESLSSQVYESVIDSSYCYGWNDPAAGGELDTVSFHSQFSLYTGAGTSAMNKSTLAGMANKYPDKQYSQPISNEDFTTESGVHYVAFNMSDMDNFGVHLNHYGWHTKQDYYDNPRRGDFAMGWGIPPSYLELAPTVLEYWYRNATANDSFIVPGAGLGYIYPTLTPELYKNTRKMGQLMERADMHNVMILDKLWPEPLTEADYYPTAHYYTRLDAVKGLFYVDVAGDYARYGREADDGNAQRIYWFDGKPMIPCRYTLWDGGQYDGISKNANQLAASINASPADPSNPDSYTFVVVHAWSYGLDEVYNTIQQLDSDVRVVTPEELIEQVYMNLSPCGEVPKKADLNQDCEVDLADYSLLSKTWLDAGMGTTDLTSDDKMDLDDLIYFQDSWLD